MLCFDLQIASLLNPNLVTTFVCYSSFSLCLLLCNQICATWKFTLGVWSVIVLWVATTVPQRNLGPPCGRSAHGCAAGCALVSRFLVMIHCRTMPMCYFHVSSSLAISPYLIRRSLYQTKSSRASFWSCKEDNLEEQVTDINNNRLQEMVDKWLYLTVPVMT